MGGMTFKDQKETKKKSSPSQTTKLDSLELKGLAWCVKQAFSSWNGKKKNGEPKTDWENPSASGEMILSAERFLRKHLSAKEYLKVFKVKDWGIQYE